MANHLPVKNVKEINSLLKPLGYELILAGKGHIYPNKKFKWTKFFGKEKSRQIPLNKVEDYIKNTNKPYCIIFSSDYPHGPTQRNAIFRYGFSHDPTTLGEKVKIALLKQDIIKI